MAAPSPIPSGSASTAPTISGSPTPALSGSASSIPLAFIKPRTPAAGLGEAPNNIEGLAFSEAAGKVFVSDSNQDDLWGLNLDATYSGTDFHSGLGSGCCFLRVAADNSGGAANGDLYVSGVSGSVVRINSSGAPHNFSASGSHITGNKLTGPFSSPGAVAVGPTGNLYVAGGAKVYVFEPSGTLLEEITEFEGSPLGSIRAIAVDPSNGNVIAASSSTVYEFESSGESLAKITEANGTTFLSIQGLAVDSTGTLYVADGSDTWSMFSDRGSFSPRSPTYRLPIRPTPPGPLTPQLTSTVAQTSPHANSSTAPIPATDRSHPARRRPHTRARPQSALTSPV